MSTDKKKGDLLTPSESEASTSLVNHTQDQKEDDGLIDPPILGNEISESTPFLSNRGHSTCAMYNLAFFAALGGFLFGYDTGVISGALLPLKRLFNLNEFWRELIVSATVGAAIFGAVSGGWFNDKLGRKLVLITSSVIFAAGALIMAVSMKKEVLLVGRLVVGVAIGREREKLL